MNIKRIILSFCLLLSLSPSLKGQDESLQIFGFFQASVTKLEGNTKLTADVPTPIGVFNATLLDQNQNYKTAQIQQLNLFFRKELSDQFTAWVNLEIINSYNSKHGWGSFALEEAWVNYKQSDAFNVKAGVLIPRFGYLNEIKNRMPLLPYITRPIIYENAVSQIHQSIFLPERANVQISGTIPTDILSIDYAAFAGGAEASYVSGTTTTSVGAGCDTSNFFLVGGRIGVKHGNLRLGVSSTYDTENDQATIQENVPRTRLGVDAGFAAYNFFFDGEYISVLLNPKTTANDLNKLFYYATLGYNISDKSFLYGSYSFVKDKADQQLIGGMASIVGGVGYKPIESVVVKAGYARYYTNAEMMIVVDPRIPPVKANLKYHFNVYQLAVSVLF